MRLTLMGAYCSILLSVTETVDLGTILNRVRPTTLIIEARFGKNFCRNLLF